MQQEYQLRISRTPQPIKIDGELTDSVWNSAEAATNFWEKWPQDKDKAKRQTEVRLAYDNTYLYVAAICYDTSQYIIQTLKRDTKYWDSDGFAIVIDPVNQQTNGFFFGVSPLNVQSEDLLSASSFGDMTFSWDNKWFSATKNHPTFWTVEMAIPFKTLRYKAGSTKWGVNFVRTDMKNNQYSTWTKVPLQFLGTDLGYTGVMIWDDAPGQAKGNISLIPYITGSAVTNHEDGEPTKVKFNAGFDAKVAVTSSLNLDLTVNPDFSQVEVDKQVTNLTRFDIFFPERRTFFLENNDLFTEFGPPPARPFFSRRIGLDRNGQTIPILFGARISGNLGNKWRVGLMNMQTKATADFAAQNYTAFAFNRRIWSRSLIKGYVHNRQNTMSGEVAKKDYSRNAGMEFLYVNKKGDWNGWAGLHLSDKHTYQDKNIYANAGGGYFGRNFTMFIDYYNIGTNYYTDMGFINRIENYDAERDSTIRMGFHQFYSEIEYNIRPEKRKRINNHSINLATSVTLNPDGSANERVNQLNYSIFFQNTSILTFQIDNQDIHLLYPFSFTEKTPFPVGKYSYTFYNLEFLSDTRKSFIFTGIVRAGQFYNGTLQSYVAGITFRRQPWGNFSLDFEQNLLRFPGDYGSTSLFLISPRAEINFSNSVFWTTFLQFNTQRNNFNINSRLQWRFRPMSDFFLVYTDNYFTDPFLRTKNRALVFKLNYWLTI
ncbi:carbohydrate binding family 9 domain-containing protein [Rhodocytophaga rosea]|uniref:Carbohydrate binding family 9 domain-containing protein n=1 Tax=Rhodocytophaga rosea TaxID=2704465 RepID=A0A6C0GKX8_9BACT|nr:carbohydrate binding family 9 domain-containing protein [Rhodocytophaga rosea]QHT68313.1 carbohydrate binding family 9 domain-containing protein [Rhodocytophaga rosea]